MSRLNHKLVEEREEFVRNLFKSNPEMTGISAQAMLTKKFGQMMSPNRLYDLKTEIVKGAKPKKTIRQKGADLIQNLSGRIRVPKGFELIQVPMLIAKR